MTLEEILESRKKAQTQVTREAFISILCVTSKFF
jgi:hypothetical protein